MNVMKMILHDLPEGIELLAKEDEILIDSKKINNYCIGCFGCWLKTPGVCVIKDEFQHMGETLAKVDELVIISKSTFGGFSSTVKNVLDRSISYVLPFFEIRKGEMHHAARYGNQIKFSAVFYGEDITDIEKETAQNLVAANALNLNGKVGTVQFVMTAKEAREVLA